MVYTRKLNNSIPLAEEFLEEVHWSGLKPYYELILNISEVMTILEKKHTGMIL